MAEPSIRKMFTALPGIVIAVFAVGVCATEPEAVYYQDCAYVAFDDIDNDELTRNEEMALVDENFFTALERSAECMNAAATAGASRIGDAAGSGSGAGGGTTGAQGTVAGSAGAGSASGTPQQTVTSQQQNQATQKGDVTGIDTQRGTGKGGSSAVCDAVIAGLEAATTQAEKEHWQGLSAEYGCQS